jgi:hypothetical protein
LERPPLETAIGTDQARVFKASAGKPHGNIVLFPPQKSGRMASLAMDNRILSHQPRQTLYNLRLPAGGLRQPIRPIRAVSPLIGGTARPDQING